MNKEQLLERITTAQLTEGSRHVVLSQDEAMALCHQLTDAHTTGLREGLRQAAAQVRDTWKLAAVEARTHCSWRRMGGAACKPLKSECESCRLADVYDARVDAAPTEVTPACRGCAEGWALQAFMSPPRHIMPGTGLAVIRYEPCTKSTEVARG